MKLKDSVTVLLHILEATAHSPFKRKTKIGPGPRKGWADGPTHKKRNDWKCKCSDYTCKCKGPKGPKTVKIGKKYKSEYNPEYKAWVAAKRKKKKGAKKKAA